VPSLINIKENSSADSIFNIDVGSSFSSFIPSTDSLSFGTNEYSFEPFPSTPYKPLPHEYSWFCVVKALQWLSPADIC
jgi:hypothetical protein